MSIFDNRKKLLLLIFLFLIGLNIFGYRFASNLVGGIVDSRVELALQDFENNINSRIRLYENLLRGAAGLFTANDHITEQEWHAYFNNRDLAGQFTGIQMLGYAPVTANKAALSSLAEQGGLSGFQMYPEQDTRLYAPVFYIEPMSEEASLVVGYNMFSEPARSAALQFAMDNNSIALTHKILPIADGYKPQSSTAVLAVMPIYKRGADISTIDQRRNNIVGFVTALLRPNELMRGVSLRVVPGIKFLIFDNSSNGEFSEDNLLYNSGDNSLAQPGFTTAHQSLRIIEWPNTKWYVRFSVVPGYNLPKLLALMPYLILGFNILLSILALLIIDLLMRRYQHAKSRANIYLDKLTAEDAVVNAINSAVIATDTTGLITVFNRRASKVFGYNSREVINKKNILDLVTTETLKSQAALLRRRLKTTVKSDFSALVSQSVIEGKDIQEWKVNTKNGSQLEIKVEVIPLYGTDDTLVGYQVTI